MAYRPMKHRLDLRVKANREAMQRVAQFTIFMVICVWEIDGERKYYFGDVGKAIDFVEWLGTEEGRVGLLDVRMYNDSWERMWISWER